MKHTVKILGNQLIVEGIDNTGIGDATHEHIMSFQDRRGNNSSLVDVVLKAIQKELDKADALAERKHQALVKKIKDRQEKNAAEQMRYIVLAREGRTSAGLYGLPSNKPTHRNPCSNS